MNGSKDSITQLAKTLSDGPLDPNVEVIIRRKKSLSVLMSYFLQVIVGCPSVFISFARGLLPSSINVAGQVKS